MKSKLVLTCVLVAVSLLLFACSSAAPKQVSVESSCDDFTKTHNITKEVQVNAGDSVNVTLCSNPSTGSSWSESAKISDQTVLQQTDHKFIAPEAKPPLVGAPGKEVWTFKTLKPGKSTVSVEYGQPWQGGQKAAWTFVLTVVAE